MDKPIAALIKDLKQRGLFDDTLVIIGGGLAVRLFARGTYPKDSCLGVIIIGLLHHDHGRGGVKSGHVHGASDELGFNIAKDPVHVHDLQATGCICSVLIMNN